MTQAIHIQGENWLTGIRGLLETLLSKGDLEAILVPTRLTVKNRIMPMLVSNPEGLAQADPLSPAFPVNAAQQLAKLTRMPAGGRLAAVLRPCEIRAFNELVKLNQGRREDVVIVGTDCPGALSNMDFRTFADRYETSDNATRTFCETVISGDFGESGVAVTSACRACDHPTPDGAP